MARKRKLPVVLDTAEMEKLIKVPNTRYLTGLRNKAMLALMLNMGLRVSEVCSLKPSHLNFTKDELYVKDGKSGDRNLKIPWEIADILKAWKKARPKSDFFFCTIKDKKAGNRFDSKKGGKVSTRYVQFMVKRYAKKAGIKKDISPHTLRHSYATEFIRRDGNVMVLKQILGHTDVSVTQIYVTLAGKDIKEVMGNWKAIV